MEDIHTLCYFGKGGYTIDPMELTGSEREWLIERLRKQYDQDAKELDRHLAASRRSARK